MTETAASSIRDLPTEHVGKLVEVARSEIGKAVIGHDDAIEALLIAMMARGHVLLEGPPGTAKTLLSRAVARAVGGVFHRVQFTPETTPAEIIGQIVRRPGGEEQFEKGPIFCNVFLADEINRGPARTQAALLEAMQERHVTVRGRTHWIESPFVVIATQNPHEHHGVFPLAESQLDRFLAKIEVGYASEEAEQLMMRLPHRGVVTDVIGDIFPFLANRGLLQVQEVADATEVDRAISDRVVRVIRFTRMADGVELGASSRAGVHLLAAAKARAALQDRAAVVPEDIDAVAPLVLTHRIIATDSRAVVAGALASA